MGLGCCLLCSGVGCCLMLVVWCVLFVGWLLFVDCSAFVFRCLGLFVLCKLLFVARCHLLVVCCSFTLCLFCVLVCVVGCLGVC